MVVTTTDRRPQYIEQFLRSCLSGGGEDVHVTVAVDGRRSDFLDDWRDHRSVSVSVADQSSAEKVRTRIFRNTLHGLSSCPLADGVLLCQDDALFCESWRQHFDVAVARAPAFFKTQKFKRQRGLVSLYAAYKFLNRPLSYYQVVKFYGLVALWLPPKTVTEMYEAMSEYAEATEHTRGVDMWVKQWCLDTVTPITCVVPNLVQHVGEDSTLGHEMVRSPMFRGEG